MLNRIVTHEREIIFTEQMSESLISVLEGKDYSSAENGELLRQFFISFSKKLDEKPIMTTKRFVQTVFLEYRGSTLDPRRADFLLTCEMTRVANGVFVISAGKIARLAMFNEKGK